MRCIAKFAYPTTGKVTLSGFSVSGLWQKTVPIAHCPVCSSRHRISVSRLHKWWATDEQMQALQDSYDDDYGGPVEPDCWVYGCSGRIEAIEGREEAAISCMAE